MVYADKRPADARAKISETHKCIDCGFDTAPGFPPRWLAECLLNHLGTFTADFTAELEMFMVHDTVWKAAGMTPWGGCLCIGCLEKRLGRKLRPRDFVRDHPFSSIPGTERLTSRRDR